jgi:hypothetical protein
VRAAVSIVFSLSNGKFSYKDNGTEIGYGFSILSNQEATNDLCTLSNPKNSVIPIGVYQISKIQCKVGTIDSPRILKLESIKRYQLVEIYDSLYSDLYIFPEIAEVNQTMEGIKGISTKKEIRKLLTAGDLIEVVYGVSYDAINQCSIVPQPQVGEVEVSNGSQTNEIVVDFKNWGGFTTMSDNMVYEGCVELIKGYCSRICQQSGSGGMVCNSGNARKIGTYDTTALTIRLMAKYKSTSSFALYSEEKSDVNFNKTDENATQLNDLEIGNITSLESLSDLNSKFIIFVSNLQNILNSGRRRKLALESSCSCNNRGTCISKNGFSMCKCDKGFYGRGCELTTEFYNALKKFSEVVIYSIENMVSNYVQLSIDPVLEAFGIISTISPVVISNDMRNSMLKSVSSCIETYGLDELDFEHIYFIISTAFNVLEEEIANDNILKSPSKYGSYTNQISLIESIFKNLLNKKVGYEYFVGRSENIALGKLDLAYHVNTPISTL